MLNLHGPGGCLSQFDSKEAPFVPGTEVAPDVLQVEGGDVAPWHARVWIAETRMQVEDLPGGALANGRPIEERGAREGRKLCDAVAFAHFLRNSANPSNLQSS